MSATQDQFDSLFRMAVMWYGVDFLPILRGKLLHDVREIAGQAQRIACEHPVHLLHTPEFVIPAFDAVRKLSGGQVTALMVFCLWVLCGEDEKTAGPLVESWPIREVVMLCNAKGSNGH